MIYVAGTAIPSRRGLFAVKIGTSKDPGARVRDLQNGSADRLRLLVVGPGGHNREAALHVEFARWRRHGEWFDLPRAQVARLVRILADGEALRRPHARHVESAGAARVAARRRRRDRLAYAGLLPPPGRPAATPVVVTFMPSEVRPLGAGRFGLQLWGFECCGQLFERTSQAAAERFLVEHRRSHPSPTP